MKIEAHIGAMWPYAQECLQPPEGGRNKEGVSHRASEGESAFDILASAHWY